MSRVRSWIRKKILDPETKKPTGRKKLVEREVVKYASAHDLRRSFGTRWARKVMPATLKLLMRHSSVDATMSYYVEMDADEVAADLWSQHQPRSGQEEPDLGTAGRFGSGKDHPKALQNDDF